MALHAGLKTDSPPAIIIAECRQMRVESAMMYAYHSFGAECVATPRRDSHIHVQLLTTLAQYAEQGLREGRASVCLSVCPSVRPSVCPTIRPGSPPYPTAAGLLLCARRVGDIDRLLHGRRNSSSAAARRLSANASSVAFTAGVGS